MDIKYVIKTMKVEKLRIKDLQIGVRFDGSVLIFDPGEVAENARPERKELEKLYGLINIAEYRR
ncbi:hypothetical protein LJR230_002209 [Trinickia sp. LjRoot230]|uniref:hypothetical protein n=1 Tax=Trinickia sp. LjRoot230 TaxID=3342288 RepID=UPI003ECE77B2